MKRPAWIDELEALAARFGGAVPADLASLTLAELWGLYGFLRSWLESGGGR
jgi:hypothetical protein